MLRGSTIIALDGSHASGKTTLIHGVTAELRARGINATCLGEPARSSPFVDDVVIHGSGAFDTALELDIFASHITSNLRAARSYSVVIADKTLVNVLTYCRLMVSLESGSWDAEIVDSMSAFCQSWNKIYDAIFYCQDHYGVKQPGDKYRDKVADLQMTVDSALRKSYSDFGVDLHLVPTALPHRDRVDYVVTQILKQGILNSGE